MYENIAEQLPVGSMITEGYIDPVDKNILIIEYYLDNQLHRITPERVNVETKLKGRKSEVYLIDGLTYNDAYQIQSDLHKLNLVKGEDYVDNPTLITTTGSLYLPISPLSSRYTPSTIMVTIVDKDMVLPEEESVRNITDSTITLFTPTEHKLFSLSTMLFDTTQIKSFNKGQMTFQFRQSVISDLNKKGMDNSICVEILSSFIIDAFNDGLSDVLILNGVSNTPYLLRYISAPNDTPLV